MTNMESFNRIWLSIQQESKLRDRWNKSTPWVLAKYPIPFGRSRGKIVRLVRLGHVRAFEIEFTGPRGGKKRRKVLDPGGGGNDWSRVDVRLASPELLAEIDQIDAHVHALREQRKELLHNRFWDRDPMSWEDLQAAHEPWRRFSRVLTRFKKGEATQEEVTEAFEALYGV